jgi:hypothetical protein
LVPFASIIVITSELSGAVRVVGAVLAFAISSVLAQPAITNARIASNPIKKTFLLTLISSLTIPIPQQFEDQNGNQRASRGLRSVDERSVRFSDCWQQSLVK